MRCVRPVGEGAGRIWRVERLLTLIASRMAAGMVMLLALAAMWLVSADAVCNLAGGDLGVTMLFIIARACITPILALIGAWLVATGAHQLW